MKKKVVERLPKGEKMETNEIFEIAKNWIEKCDYYKKMSQKFVNGKISMSFEEYKNEVALAFFYGYEKRNNDEVFGRIENKLKNLENELKKLGSEK